MSARSRGALALALTALWSLPARAETTPDEARVLLEWSRGPGAESCLSPEEAATEVERLLSRPVFATSSTDRRLVVSIERTADPPGYKASMRLFAASGAPLGQREIVIAAERCEQATEAFTLALSIMADIPRTPGESLPPPPPESHAAPPVPSAPVSPPPLRTRAPDRVGIGIGPAAAIVATPATPSLGGHVSVLFEPTGFIPVLGGVVSTVRSHEVLESRRAWLSSTQLEATLCVPPLSAKSLSVFACLGPEATIHVGWGAGFGDARSGVSTTVGAIARAYVRQMIGERAHLFASFGIAATPRALEVAFTEPGGARREALRTAYFSPFLSFGIAFDDFLRTPRGGPQ